MPYNYPMKTQLQKFIILTPTFAFEGPEYFTVPFMYSDKDSLIHDLSAFLSDYMAEDQAIRKEYNEIYSKIDIDHTDELVELETALYERRMELDSRTFSANGYCINPINYALDPSTEFKVLTIDEYFAIKL